MQVHYWCATLVVGGTGCCGSCKPTMSKMVNAAAMSAKNPKKKLRNVLLITGRLCILSWYHKGNEFEV